MRVFALYFFFAGGGGRGRGGGWGRAAEGLILGIIIISAEINFQLLFLISLSISKIY